MKLEVLLDRLYYSQQIDLVYLAGGRIYVGDVHKAKESLSQEIKDADVCMLVSKPNDTIYISITGNGL